MVEAVIITAWKEPDEKPQSPIEGSRRPQVFHAYRPEQWSDITGTPSENMPSKVPLLIIKGMWNDKVFSQMVNDPSYEKSILWSSLDKNKEESISLKGVTDIVAHLVEVHNVDQDSIDIGLSDVKFGDKREVVSGKLAEWLRTQEKAEK